MKSEELDIEKQMEMSLDDIIAAEKKSGKRNKETRKDRKPSGKDAEWAKQQRLRNQRKKEKLMKYEKVSTKTTTRQQQQNGKKQVSKTREELVICVEKKGNRVAEPTKPRPSIRDRPSSRETRLVTVRSQTQNVRRLSRDKAVEDRRRSQGPSLNELFSQSERNGRVGVSNGTRGRGSSSNGTRGRGSSSNRGRGVNRNRGRAKSSSNPLMRY